jgi:tRNA modification GTPase
MRRQEAPGRIGVGRRTRRVVVMRPVVRVEQDLRNAPAPIAGPQPPGPYAALLTPVGRGAIAVVAVGGPGAVEAVARGFVPSGPIPLAAADEVSTGKPGTMSVRVGRWSGPGSRGMGGGLPPEEVLVLAEASGVVEVQCHGGIAACERILRDLEAVGCSRVDWWEWSRLVEGDGIEWEARLALAAARGPKAAAILSHQLAGALTRRLAEIRRLLASGGPDRDSARQFLRRLQAWGPLGARLTTPFRVVVIGPPNVGKSSLVNALAGYSRSLVDALPGTTRDLVATRLVIGGWECEVFDTAGLRENAADDVERAGIEAAATLTRSADLVVHVRDATRAGDGPDAGLDAEWPAPDSRTAPEGLRVLSKCDLTAGSAPPGPQRFGDGRGRMDRLYAPIATSSLTGLGIDLLAGAIRRSLVPREPPPGEPVPFTIRQLSEIDALLREAGLDG